MSAFEPVYNNLLLVGLMIFAPPFYQFIIYRKSQKSNRGNFTVCQRIQGAAYSTCLISKATFIVYIKLDLGHILEVFLSFFLSINPARFGLT
ncbi:MAG: hypothetical protein JWQ66_4214 [Mucilaginibacter sp.]|nr:hypothetical protein [Mucilaginibacter sp.]